MSSASEPSMSLAEEQVIKVLLAEDDPTQRLLLERLIQNAGYIVRSTSDGADALNLILEGQYDILVTDLEMPGLDGQSLCQRIREASLTQYVYILMLTARTTDEDLAAGLGAGA